MHRAHDRHRSVVAGLAPIIITQKDLITIIKLLYKAISGTDLDKVKNYPAELKIWSPYQTCPGGPACSTVGREEYWDTSWFFLVKGKRFYGNLFESKTPSNGRSVMSGHVGLVRRQTGDSSYTVKPYQLPTSNCSIDLLGSSFDYKSQPSENGSKTAIIKSIIMLIKPVIAMTE